MRLHDVSTTLTNVFLLSSYARRLVIRFYLFNIPELFSVLFELLCVYQSLFPTEWTFPHINCR